VDNAGNNLNNRLPITTLPSNPTGPYPIVVNAYAAFKYHLKVGDNISFHIDNKTDLYEKKLRTVGGYDPNKDNSTLAQFNVVGINTTYQGEEYFVNQDVANYLLGLRSHLSPDNFNLHE
jgi:hypothetical protein